MFKEKAAPENGNASGGRDVASKMYANRSAFPEVCFRSTVQNVFFGMFSEGVFLFVSSSVSLLCVQHEIVFKTACCAAVCIIV